MRPGACRRPALEDEYGVDIDEHRLFESKTIADIEALLAQSTQAPAPHALPRWAHGWPGRIARQAIQSALVFPAVRFSCRPLTIEGADHLRDVELPALFIANHNSHFDTPTVLMALPSHIRRRTCVAAAADYFYRSALPGAVFSLCLGTFPFSREGSVRTSLQHCGELVDDGWSLLIYPEGTRSPSGEPQAFKAGIGLLASELRVPVVPMWLEGLRAVLPKGASRPQRGPVRVRIGEPLRVQPGADYGTVTECLEQSLARLRDVTRPPM